MTVHKRRVFPEGWKNSMWSISKKWGWVLDPFLWSATTAIECEELKRNIIWIDIQKELVDRAKDLIDSKKIHAHFWVWDSWSKETRKDIEKILKHRKIDWVDLALLHPPYADIIKFTDKKEDLSNSGSVENFLLDFGKVLKIHINYWKINDIWS